MIKAAPKDVLLCSLDWAWITITRHLPLIPQCWENHEEWSKAFWAVHNGTEAVLSWYICIVRALQDEKHQSAGAFDIIAIEYRQPAQHELWQFQFPKTCIASPLWHSLKHEVIVPNLSYLKYQTWLQEYVNTSASSFHTFNCSTGGFYLYTRSDAELIMQAQGNALWCQCSPCDP